MKRLILSICVFSLLLSFFPFWAGAATYTIINGEMTGSAPATISGWDGIVASGRENGPFQGTVAYQAINSPFDPNTGSGSTLLTATAGFCSLTQQLGFTATGQTLTVTADVAWDGNWGYLFFGFYEETLWDRMPDASVDITLTVPPDTDGTLDSFHTVSVTGPLTNTGNPVRVFIGSACTPYGTGALIPGTSKFAIDHVTPDPPLAPTPTPTPVPLAAQNWGLYE
jgi:hypothetical protein